MVEFPCGTCGWRIVVGEEARGGTVVCSNCNTRQAVPGGAVDVRQKVAELRAALKSEIKEPVYSELHTVAAILVVLGAVQCAVSVVLAFGVSPAMLLGIAGGVVMMGLGLGLLCLRNIAIDVWHIRQRDA